MEIENNNNALIIAANFDYYQNGKLVAPLIHGVMQNGKRLFSCLLCIILFVSMTGCNSKIKENSSVQINLNDYVHVEFSGDNMAGYALAGINKEKFLLDHINNISFNKENVQVYRELYGDTDESAAKAVLRYISVSLDKSNYLSNDDVVNTVWKIDTEKISTYFEIDYTCSSQPFIVSGLKDAETFDPFEGLSVTFSGIAPYGEVNVCSDYISNFGGTYQPSKSDNLRNGDTITITYTCPDKAEMISQCGMYPSCYENTYTVSGLNKYVQSVSEISKEDYDKLVSDAAEKVWVLGYGNYTEAKFCGTYFYTAKDKPAHGVHFLSWCGTPVGNAVCFVFEHPEEIGKAGAPNVYTVITLENLLMDTNGNLVYSRHDMAERFNKYESQSALKEEFIGVFDDIMNCSDNTDFN